jgi:hypothetical protein
MQATQRQAATRPRTNPDCPSSHRHGTIAAACLDRCTCPEATARRAAYEKRRVYDAAQGLRRTVPAVGTNRRIQALYAIGWPGGLIAAELGFSRSRLTNLTNGQRVVYAATAARVRDLYDRLSGRRGPSRVTAGRAAQLGYVPPIGWDDDQIDDPAGRPWAVIDDHGQRRYGESFSRPSARGDAERARALERQRVRRAAARRAAAEEQLRQVTALIAAGDAAEVAS